MAMLVPTDVFSSGILEMLQEEVFNRRPRCVTCDDPVDSIIIGINPYYNGLVIITNCHGYVKQQVIAAEIFYNLNGIKDMVDFIAKIAMKDFECTTTPITTLFEKGFEKGDYT